MDETNDLSLWPILYRVPDDLLHLVDRFFIFNNGESVLLFCQNGRIYGFGQNYYGMLGVHHEDLREKLLNLVFFHCCYHSFPVLESPRELIKLRFQNVISISKGDKHIMALTELGDLYGWGANYSGQLGIGWYRTCSLEPTLIMHDVQKVCCGPKHTVALIFDGSIRIMGKFPGCPHSFTPKPLIQAPSMVDLISTKFLTIAYNNCFDDNGKSAFYTWGDLKYFGLSGTSSTVRLTYKRCDYERIFKIIPIGYNKIMVLSHEGRLSIISIQNERVRSFRDPFRPLSFINFCIDIADDPNVVVMSDRQGRCYLWDERKPSGQNLIKAQWLKSIPDAACLYSSAFTPQITRLPKALLNEDARKKKSSWSHFKFNDPRFADIIFRFKQYQYKPIYCHRAVLMDHSDYFAKVFSTKNGIENLSKVTQSDSNEQNVFQSTWSNSNAAVVIIMDERNSCSFISMFYYLRYVYNGEMALDQFDDVMYSEMYHIASNYGDHKLIDMIVDQLYKNDVHLDQTTLNITRQRQL